MLSWFERILLMDRLPSELYISVRFLALDRWQATCHLVDGTEALDLKPERDALALGLHATLSILAFTR